MKTKRKQKFKQFCICKLLTDSWKYCGYPKGTKVIILGSYNDEYGEGNIDDYYVAPLNKKGEVVDKIAWLGEKELEFVSARSLKNIDLITIYSSRHDDEGF